jgi:hypothetical protein
MIHCKRQIPRFGQGFKLRTVTVEIGKCRKVVVRLTICQRSSIKILSLGRMPQTKLKMGERPLCVPLYGSNQPLGHELTMYIATVAVGNIMQDGDNCGLFCEG